MLKKESDDKIKQYDLHNIWIAKMTKDKNK